MADCGDHDYQMVEFANLFDLREMQLYRAQIDAIYGPTNTADVTMMDECPEYSTTPEVLGVPFWYHCDFSTGTLSDLAQGFRAFSVYDIVYVLAVPANGSVPARMYIVGHVDIRGTRICEFDWILVTLPYGKYGEYKTAATIFSAYSGQVLDIANFINKDDLSPAKPTTIPCEYTTAFINWMTYNFNTMVTPAATVPCSTSFVYAQFPITSTNSTTGTAYDGSVFVMTSPPNDACTTFNLGGEQHTRIRATEATSVARTDLTTRNRSLVCLGAETFHYGSPPSDQSCSLYWADVDRDTNVTWDWGPTGKGFRFVDDVRVQTAVVQYTDAHTYGESIDFECDGTTSTATVQMSHAYVAGFDSTGVGGYALTSTGSCSITSSFYTTEAPYTGAGKTLQPVTSTGAFDSTGYPNIDFWSCMDTKSKCVKVGSCGCYIFGGVSFSRAKPRSDMKLTIGTYSSGAGDENTSKGWGGDLAPAMYGQPSVPDEYYIYAAPFVSLTTFDSSFDTTQPVSVLDCLSSANGNASMAAINTIHALYSWCGQEVGTASADVDFWWTRASNGPEFMVIKRKPYA